MDAWPFEEPENAATITVRQIAVQHEPILLVSRDAEDGMWQFLTGQAFDVSDAMFVGLREMFRMDPTIGNLADLPIGWEAWRAGADQPWRWRRAEAD